MYEDGKANRWFYGLIAFQIVLWTIMPTLLRYVLPMDAMEGTSWGSQLQWGYDKDPFLNAWLTRLALSIGRHADWMIYCFSQLAVAICFWAIWQLGKRILSPFHALVGVFLLTGIQYFHLAAIDFNDNVLQLPLWALTTLCFYDALKYQSLRAWLGVGLFAGLAMMAKYYAVMLLMPMFIFLLIDKTARQSFTQAKLYIAVGIFLLTILPHTLWLFSHDFLTLQYSFGRLGQLSTWRDHWFYPSYFLLTHMANWVLPILLLGVLTVVKPSTSVKLTENRAVTEFDRRFLICLGLGPILITAIFSLILGWRLHPLWAMPVVSLWGILSLAIFPLTLTRQRFYVFIALILGVQLLFAGAYSMALLRTGSTSSANFPGKEIAHTITQLWHKQYQRPLHYVAGPRWLAGNIAHYSTDHPQVYIDWNSKISTWIDEQQLIQQGAVFVWLMHTDHDKKLPPVIQEGDLPLKVLARFPHLIMLPPQHFSWLRPAKTPNEIKVGMGILPPQQ